MASIGDTTRPAFAYDQATDTWVPVGIGPHSHTAAGVGAVATSSFAAKGDLLVGTGAGTLVAQTVGANGTVLTADSTQADGVKWAAPVTGTTFSGASVTDASAISVPTSTFTRLTYTQEQYDTDSYHSNSTNTSRLTIPAGKTGYYQVNGQVVYNLSSGGGMRGLYIYLNGTSTFGSPDISAPSGQYPGVALTWNAYLTAGDYVELYAYQTSGASLNCFVDATQARFQINYLGA